MRSEEGSEEVLDPALAILPFHEVGGSRDSGELAEVGTKLSSSGGTV